MAGMTESAKVRLDVVYLVSSDLLDARFSEADGYNGFRPPPEASEFPDLFLPTYDDTNQSRFTWMASKKQAAADARAHM